MVSSVNPLIIAHRGASKEAPENTLAAIKRGLALKADYIEIDVRLSKDGIPIVLHDPSASRMIGVKGSPPIRQLTLDQIKQIGIGKRFGRAFADEKIPTLAEVLDLNWAATGLMIEIKKSVRDPKILVDAVFGVLASIKKPLPRIFMGSFDLEIIQQVQKQVQLLNSPIKVIGIIEKKEMITRFIEQKIQHLALWYKLMNWELAYFLREKKIPVWTFTVDDLKVAKFLISLGINGIISNDPKMLQESEIFRLH